LADNKGDVKVGPCRGKRRRQPRRNFGSYDLTALAFQEQEETFVFHLSVADLTADSQAGTVEQGLFTVDFRFGDRLYRIQIQRVLPSRAAASPPVRPVASVYDKA